MATPSDSGIIRRLMGRLVSFVDALYPYENREIDARHSVIGVLLGWATDRTLEEHTGHSEDKDKATPGVSDHDTAFLENAEDNLKKQLGGLEQGYSSHAANYSSSTVSELCPWSNQPSPSNKTHGSEEVQKAAEQTESTITLEPHQLLLLQHTGFKKDVEKSCLGLTVNIARKTMERLASFVNALYPYENREPDARHSVIGMLLGWATDRTLEEHTGHSEDKDMATTGVSGDDTALVENPESDHNDQLGGLEQGDSLLVANDSSSAVSELYTCSSQPSPTNMTHGLQQHLTNADRRKDRAFSTDKSQQNVTASGKRDTTHTAFRAPRPCVMPINDYKLQFMKQGNIDNLREELRTKHACLHFLSTALQIDCTLTADTAYAQELSKTWTEEVKEIVIRHVSNIKYKIVQTLGDDTWAELEDCIAKGQFESSELILIQVQEKRTYVVVGKNDVEEVFERLRDIASAAEDKQAEVQKAAEETESTITLEPHQLLLLQHTGFKEDTETSCPGLTVNIARKTKDVTFRGTVSHVQAGQTRMRERLDRLRSAEIPMSQAQISLLSKPETRNMVREKCRADSIVAVWQEVSGRGQTTLGVYTLSDLDVTRACDVIQRYVVERECDIPAAASELTQSKQLYSFIQTLRAVNEGKVEITTTQGGRKIVVTATCDIIDNVLTEVTHFFREKSRFSITISLGKDTMQVLKLFRRKEVDAIAKEYSVNIALEKKGLRYRGTEDGMLLACQKLQSVIDTIVKYQYTLTDEIEIMFLNTDKCKEELLNLEKSKRCVLSLDPDVPDGQKSPNCESGSEAGASSTESQNPSSVISVSIVQGNLAEQQVDMLVCSAPGILSIKLGDVLTSFGGVLTSLLKTGGDGLKQEFLAKHPGKLEPGKAIYTSGHRLACKWICHLVLPEYESGVQQVLETLITSCLIEANKAGFTSVAFPVLGTDGLGYPPEVVARTILAAVSKFERDMPSTTLRDVREVINHKDTAILKIFQQVHRELESSQTDAATARRKLSTKPSSSDQGPKKTLYIYAQSQEDVFGIMESLEQILERHIKTHTVKEMHLRSMAPDERRNINALRLKYGVQLFETTSGHLVLKGLSDAVLEAAVEVTNMLHKKDKKQLHDTAQRLVQWYYLKPPNAGMVDHTAADNFSIEQAFKANAPTTKISMRQDNGRVQRVVVNFTTMEQHPADNPADTFCLIRRDKTQDMVTSRLPDNWTSTQDYRVTLVASSPEYRAVQTNFAATVGDKPATIVNIERVQNERLRRQYTAQKDHLDKQNIDHPNEMTLWHGTHPAAVDSIMQHGFNRSYCGLNATAYGQGVYFSPHSNYSAEDTYSKPGVSGHKHVFQCKVLVGHTVNGKSTMRYLPDRLPGIPYDSATDNVTSPHMYIVFNDNQAYPEYLITFIF